MSLLSTKGREVSSIENQAIGMAERRVELERNLLQLLMADPAQLLPLAMAEGVRVDQFSDDDTKAVAEAVFQWYGSRREAMDAACVALIDAGLYADWVHPDETRLRQWSIPRLVRWSRRYFHDFTVDVPSLTASMAASLVEVAERMDQAAKLVSQYFALMGAGIIYEGRAL